MSLLWHRLTLKRSIKLWKRGDPPMMSVCRPHKTRPHLDNDVCLKKQKSIRKTSLNPGPHFQGVSTIFMKYLKINWMKNKRLFDECGCRAILVSVFMWWTVSSCLHVRTSMPTGAQSVGRGYRSTREQCNSNLIKIYFLSGRDRALLMRSNGLFLFTCTSGVHLLFNGFIF